MQDGFYRVVGIETKSELQKTQGGAQIDTFLYKLHIIFIEGKKARGNLFGGAFKLRETNVFNRLLLI